MKRILTLLACSALLMGAIAVPVMAHGDDDTETRGKHDHDASDRPDKDSRPDKDAREEKNETSKDAAKDARKAFAEDRKAAAKERQAAFREAREACKAMYGDKDESDGNMTGNASMNATGNETSEHKNRGDCVSDAAHDPAHKARRAYHHLSKQIDAVEHRIAKLEIKEYRVDAKLAEGNLTVNETAELEQKLERIEAAQGKLVEKLEDLYAKLQALKDRVAAASDAPSDDAVEEESELEEESESESDDSADA